METNNTKHAPGPWHTSKLGYDFGIYADHKPALDLAIVRHLGTTETEHNARLIAAAPELLRALKSLVDLWGIGGSADDFVVRLRDGGFMDEARAILAEIEGER